MLIIGHRGAMGYEPENTLRSFQRAIDLGVDMIEFDVHLCKTGKLVIIHDKKVNRTTNGRGLIKEKTLTELKELDAGKGEKIPTLEEALDLIDKQVKVNIELKGKNTAQKTCEIVSKYGMVDDVIFSASSIKPLLTVRKQIPQANTALIYVSIENLIYYNLFRFFSLILFPLTKIIILLLAKKSKVNYIHLDRVFVKKRFIKKLHDLGYKINVWTIRKPEQAEKMKKLGIDGIFMNYPDKI